MELNTRKRSLATTSHAPDPDGDDGQGVDPLAESGDEEDIIMDMDNCFSPTEDENDISSDEEGDDDDSDEPSMTHEEYKKQIRDMLNISSRFKSSINYVTHASLIPYFWGSVHQYFQELMELFIISDGWMLNDFLRVAESKKLHLIFRCAYTKKGRIEQMARHFRIVFQIILDAAKFQWLAPWKTRNTFGISICTKRQIGGFFLAYYLLLKQPEPILGVLSTEKQKIIIDPDDSRSIRFFINDVNKLEDAGKGKELKKEVKLLFLRLHHQNLLEKCLLRDNYSLDASALILASCRSNPRLSYFGVLKDVRDKLLYMTYQGIGNAAFREMLRVARDICDTSKKTRGTETTNPQSSSKPVVTFQTKLRQRLDSVFQQHFKSTPSACDEQPEASIPVKEEILLTKKRKAAKQKSKNSFPPERKSNWTVADVIALKNERDLAVIAFRVVEILKFVTPENPLTISRLVKTKVDETVTELIDKKMLQDKKLHDKRLQCPSREARLSKKGNHRFIETVGTKSWKEYLTSDVENPSNNIPKEQISPAELLEKMKTHKVIGVEPNLIFAKKKEQELSSDEDEELEFDFEDKDEFKSKLKALKEAAKQQQMLVHKEKLPAYSLDMPDLGHGQDSGPFLDTVENVIASTSSAVSKLSIQKTDNKPKKAPKMKKTSTPSKKTPEAVKKNQRGKKNKN